MNFLNLDPVLTPFKDKSDPIGKPIHTDQPWTSVTANIIKPMNRRLEFTRGTEISANDTRDTKDLMTYYDQLARFSYIVISLNLLHC